MDFLQIRLCPSEAQAAKIEKTFACCLLLYNRMLSDREKLLGELGRHFIPSPARYKRELPVLKEADSLALGAVHTELERAFRDHSFNPHDHKKPEPAEECLCYTTFCQQTSAGPTIRFAGGGLKLPKLGVVPAEPHREPARGSTIRWAEIYREDAGYFCRLACQAAGAAAGAALEKQPA